MTSTVLDKAIAECAAWHAAGRDLTVSVNLSVRNLHDPMLSSQVVADARAPLPAAAGAQARDHREHDPVGPAAGAATTVESLSELGVRFAVDDFGTGHSSLANLRMLPVHELKIDRSFVTPMLNDESDGVIVRSTIELGHALGLKVIAEGVEDATHARAPRGDPLRSRPGPLLLKADPADRVHALDQPVRGELPLSSLRVAGGRRPPTLTQTSCGGAAPCRRWCGSGEHACERGSCARPPASPARCERC